MLNCQLNGKEVTGKIMVKAETRFESPHKTTFWIVITILIALLGLGIFGAGGQVGIKIDPLKPAIGKRTPVKIELSEPRRGLVSVKVELIQDRNSVVLEEKTYKPSSQFLFWRAKTVRDAFEVEAGSTAMPSLTSGFASLRVTAARAKTWIRRPEPNIVEIKLPVRLAPPSLQITSSQTYVAQGGCEAVTYRVGETAVRDGVQAGNWWFPGYPMPWGGRQDRFAIFAVPYDMAQPRVRLIAEDEIGNQAEISFIDKLFPRTFKSDSIEVTESFMRKVVPEIMSQAPHIKDRGNLLDNYLAINRELRAENDQTLKQLASSSKPQFLWSRPFLRLPNAKVMAAFADHRTYMYQGRIIDHQYHLGYDLAVTRQYPVPAANDGIVVYARYFGIYGNTVIIDHGCGLQTIYGHLSSIAVKEGEEIKRGQILGKTGETGLAGGDHLHFCTLLQGLAVNPIEWWDGHWIKDRIAKKLGAAWPFAE